MDHLPSGTDVVCLQEVFRNSNMHCRDKIPYLTRAMNDCGLTYHTTPHHPHPLPSNPVSHFLFQSLIDIIYVLRSYWWAKFVLMAVLMIPLFILVCVLYLLFTNTQHTDGGLVVYSRWPILSYESYPWMHTSDVHFPENVSAKGFLWVRIDVQGQVLNIMNLHSCSACSPEVNRKQLKELAIFIECKVPSDEPIAIMGDFNVPHCIFRDLLPEFSTGEIDNPCTWRGMSGDRCRHLDHILCNRLVRMSDYKVISPCVYMSDHTPVQCTLEIVR